MIATVLSLVPVLVLGGALTRGTRCRSTVLRLSMAMALGCSTMSVFAFLWSLVFGLSRNSLWLGEAALTAMCWWRVPYAAEDRVSGEESLRASAWSTALLAVVVAASLLRVFCVAHEYPFGDGDAMGIWNTRAMFLYREWSNWTWVFAGDFLAHVDYPLMVPMLNARAFIWAGEPLAFAPQLHSLLFGGLLVGLVFGILCERRGPDVAACGASALLAAPFFVTHAVMQSADLQVAAYLCIAGFAVGEMTRLRPGRRAAKMSLVLGAALGSLLWTKNEGLVTALLLVGVGCCRCAAVARGRGPVKCSCLARGRPTAAAAGVRVAEDRVRGRQRSHGFVFGRSPGGAAGRLVTLGAGGRVVCRASRIGDPRTGSTGDSATSPSWCSSCSPVAPVTRGPRGARRRSSLACW